MRHLSDLGALSRDWLKGVNLNVDSKKVLKKIAENYIFYIICKVILRKHMTHRA